MSRLQIRVWLRVCQHGLLLLGTVGALRLGYVAWATRASVPTLTPTPAFVTSTAIAPPPRTQLSLIEQLRLPAAPLPSELLQEAMSPPASASAAPPRPKPLRVYVALNQKLERTEIRLNGVVLGHSPYVGEIDCMSGESLEFVLIPPKGPPRRSVHVCDRTEILIDETER